MYVLDLWGDEAVISVSSESIPAEPKKRILIQDAELHLELVEVVDEQ